MTRTVGQGLTGRTETRSLRSLGGPAALSLGPLPPPPLRFQDCMTARKSPSFFRRCGSRRSPPTSWAPRFQPNARSSGSRPAKTVHRLRTSSCLSWATRNCTRSRLRNLRRVTQCAQRGGSRGGGGPVWRCRGYPGTNSPAAFEIR